MLALVGGNCSVQGLDIEGQDKYWTVSGWGRKEKRWGEEGEGRRKRGGEEREKGGGMYDTSLERP